MRINLTCDFADKDIVKSLGAKWDSARKTWFIIDIEDLTPFMRWIPSHRSSQGTAQVDSITLKEYLASRYTSGAKALTASAARAFRVPYPLEHGWHAKYATNAISLEAMQAIKKKVGSKRKQTIIKHAAKVALFKSPPNGWAPSRKTKA